MEQIENIKNTNKVLRIIFDGFCDSTKNYGRCFLLLREEEYSISRIYNIVRSYKFQICSELKIDVLIHDLCMEEEADFKECYLEALENAHSFTHFAEGSIENIFHFRIPRFSELDFQEVIIRMGGHKIIEKVTKTPDFFINNIAIELKDLQMEGLYDKARQISVSKIFGHIDGYSINIDFLNLEKESYVLYKSIISKSIKSIVKKASKQVKEFKQSNEINSAGVILINTGYFSLSHNLFKAIVEDIIAHQTKTIEFAYIFTQSVLNNSIGDAEVFYYQDFIGIVPDNMKDIKENIDILVKKKMSSIFQEPNPEQFVPPQEPISFLEDNKIFYWTPKRLKPSWDL